MKTIMILAALGLSFTAHSRSVDIAIQSGQSELTLANPSGVTVNYDIVCHKADGSGTIINNTGQTLAPNAKSDVSISILDSQKCAGDATPAYSYSDKNGDNVYACSGSVTYDNADTLCGTGNSFCMPESQYTACGTWLSCTAGQIWVKSETADVYSGCSWGYSFDRTNNAIFIDAAGSCGSYNVKKTPATNTAEYYAYGNIVPKTNTYGALCCAGSGTYSSYCRVTIHNTDNDARLLSPSFRSGAAF